MSAPEIQRHNELFEKAFSKTNLCIQCGYCLPACPTYQSMGTETASPRGRINLVKMAAEGKIDVTKDMAGPIDLCLGCRACEIACPVNVPYGQILEAAKEIIQKEKPKKTKDHFVHLLLTKGFTNPKFLNLIGDATWLYQKSGLNKLVQKTNAINLVAKPLGFFEKILPPVQKPSKRTKRGEWYKTERECKGKVAFFVGCVTDAMMHETNNNTIKLLNTVGLDVFIPEKQKCCGALHAHQGLLSETKELAKENLDVFKTSGIDYIVNSAGGCGAMLHEYRELLHDEPEWQQKAEAFSKKSVDVSVLLVKYGPLPFKREWNGIITYQPSCHLSNVQGVTEEPRQLLRSIPGANFIEMKDSDSCCASGGIYNLIHYEESSKILASKMENVKNTEATTVVTSNPGCLLQMKHGADKFAKDYKIETSHLVDLLVKLID
ncbi:(Fe-S)-binding protein [Bacillaceae bacterium IKA-2]|jgi:glycolate oxidase iron-sulfur subunit|nr:(Fe-S)-binding protein [Bacillaceae bacterium IKA-2]